MARRRGAIFRPPSTTPSWPTKTRRPIRVAYERRNRDLDPQLVWRGKDEQDTSDLIVQAPPLYIQEKVHPKVLVDDLLRESKARRQEEAADDVGISSPTSMGYRKVQNAPNFTATTPTGRTA